MDPMLLLLGLLYLGGRKRPAVGAVDDQAAPPANPDASPMGMAPTVYAYLYQLPDDSFATTRMAFGTAGATPAEMGVFGSPDKAVQLAQQKGWVLAWQGVKQLATRPGT